MTNFTIQEWRAVPNRVAELLLPGAELKCAHVTAAKTSSLLATSMAAWNPHDNTLNVYTWGAGDKKARDAYAEQIQLVRPVFKDAAESQPDPEHEILLKRAGIPVLAPAMDFTQKALGGPNPLTNTLVASLLAGGLGYGAGTLVENLFPERYIERGTLRKNLGMLGVLGGVGLGASNAYANARGNMTGREFYKAPFKNFMRGYLMRNDRPLPRFMNTNTMSDMPATPSILDDSAKYAAFGQSPGQFGTSGLYTPMIPVQQFNQSVWQDTQRGMAHGFQQHTPPAFAAATTGMLSGLSAGTRSPIIRPIDVINGIASAGVGLATAHVAGRALSALAGLTPAGQEKLQDLGLFGGMMHAIAPAVLGMR